MNQLLFGVIGMLMLAITGVGFTEVKSRADEKLALQQPTGSVQNSAETITESSVGSIVSSKNKAGASTQNGTVAGALAQVTRSVADAVDDVTVGWSRDDGDSDGDDQEYEYEGEDDEDERGQVPTRAPAPTPPPSPVTATPQPTNPSGPTVRSFTMALVAAHNSAASCYSAINGSVYDLTSFIGQHPGGQAAIKSLCGVDGSAAFNGQHGGAGRPASELASFKIGILAN